MRLTLRRLDAGGPAWTFDDFPVTLGRDPGNRVHLADERVSRRHAEIRQAGDQLLLEDRDSTGGTYLNEARVRFPVLLNPGDVIRLATVRLRAEFGAFVRGVARPAWGGTPVPPSEEWYAALGRMLRENHVVVSRAEEAGLQAEFADPASPRGAVLAEGFHRFVAIDAAAGLDTAGRFARELFLLDVRRRLAVAFDLPLDPAAYHGEDVSQLLKDEPASLFCLLNFDVVPVRAFGLLRGFTQGAHRILLLCSGARDLHAEEAELKQDDSVLDLVLVPSAWLRIEPVAPGLS